MPIKQIKIDRSFVQAALDDKRSNKLVTGIIKIGLDLNLRVLVEGIETAEQFSAFKVMVVPSFRAIYGAVQCL